MFKLILILIFSIQIWALKERALFSIEDQVLFTTDVNKIHEKYRLSECVLGKNSFISKFTGLSSKQRKLNASASPLNINQREFVLSIVLFERALSLEVEGTANLPKPTCAIPKSRLRDVAQVYLLDKHLKDSFDKFVKEFNPKTDAVSNFRRHILESIDYRLFL